MILIYTTTSDEEEAERIGTKILKEKLAVCANIIPKMNSIYWWNGSLTEDNETILILKTLEKNLETVMREIKKIHSYDNPCIIALPVLKASDSYLKWIENEID